MAQMKCSGNTESHSLNKFHAPNDSNAIENCTQKSGTEFFHHKKHTPNTYKKQPFKNNRTSKIFDNVSQQIILIQESDTTAKHLLKKYGTWDAVEKAINSKYLTILNKRYLGDSILNASKNAKYLIVKSGMGTGKTTAMKKIIDSEKVLESLPKDTCILFISPRKKLNYAMANDLGMYYYEDVKNETSKIEREQMARRMVITPQSLGAILKEFPDIRYKYVVMDESQSIADMIVSSVTKNKIDTLDALRQACLLADHIVAMDAHVDIQTEKLIEKLSDNEKIHYLLNINKSWAGFTATLIDGGKYTDRRDTIDKLQIDAINDDQTIYIASSSKSYCDSREKTLKKLFPHLRILNITSKTTAEAEKLLSDPDSIKNWDVIIGSPSIAIGVSFDIKNHIDEVFGVFPNAEKSGGSDDAIQSLARPRKPLNSHWTLVLDDNKKLFQHPSKYPTDISQAIGDRYIRAKFIAGIKDIEIIDGEKRVIDLFSTCEHARIHDKNNFNKNFLSRLDEMGVEVTKVDYKTIGVNQESKDIADEEKQKAKEQAIKIKTTSPRIDEDEFNRIRALKKFQPMEVTKEQDNSFERYKFESKFNINCDDLSNERLNTYLEYDDNGDIQKCINREITLSSSDFLKKYMDARLTGIGENSAFKVDVIDSKLNLPLSRKLFSYAMAFVESGEEYTHKSLKRSPLVRFVKRHYNEITKLDVVRLPKNWKEKPVLLLNSLLEDIGYKHTSKRMKGTKKREYIYKACIDESIEQLYSERKEQGRGWVESTEDLILYHKHPALHERKKVNE